MTRPTKDAPISVPAGRLQGAIAVVSGASRGIGRAIAQAFAAEGARLCLIATDQEKLRGVAASLEGIDEPPLCIGADVADRQACQRRHGAALNIA